MCETFILILKMILKQAFILQQLMRENKWDI